MENRAAELLKLLDTLSLADVEALPEADRRRLQLLLDHWSKLTNQPTKPAH